MSSDTHAPTERLKGEEPTKNTSSHGNKRPQAPRSLKSDLKLPDRHFSTFKAHKVPPMVGLARRQGPWLLLKRFIVPPASALPRKLKKSKKSRVAQNYTSWPHRRLGASQTHQKKQPKWQHQSSGTPTGPSRNVGARLCPGPGPKPPAFSSLRPRSPPPPFFDNNRGLAADSKTCTRNSE